MDVKNSCIYTVFAFIFIFKKLSLKCNIRLMKNLEELIPTYKDFPQKGINFKDLLEIIHDPEVFNELIIKMSSSPILEKSEAIISIDARGFIFGSAIAFQSSKPMIVARKPGKLPGEIVTEKYKLEYGENSLSIQKSSLMKYNSFAIVDDLLATGGTVNCVSELLNNNNKKVVGLLVVAELSNLNGKSRFNFPVESFISF